MKVLATVLFSSCAKNPVTVVYLRYDGEFFPADEFLDSPMPNRLKTESKNKAGLARIMSE